MKAKGIKIGCGVTNKTFFKENEEVNELIKIVNYFPEFRDKNKIKTCNSYDYLKFGSI
tara:strand:+ start:738 stop:911 length:174 start_codon:yes stop_codon:yes gene_type:complete